MTSKQKDNPNYEDSLRQLLGMKAYVMFTYDKAISNILKPMNNINGDNLSNESWKLYKKYEDCPNQFREEIYYNDFLRLVQANSDQDVLIRLGKYAKFTLLVHCKLTGIVSVHGFSFVPTTTNVALAQSMKYYKRDFCIRNEDMSVLVEENQVLAYKSADFKNGSMHVPYTPVFLNRNMNNVMNKYKTKRREAKTSEKVSIIT